MTTENNDLITQITNQYMQNLTEKIHELNERVIIMKSKSADSQADVTATCMRHLTEQLRQANDDIRTRNALGDAKMSALAARIRTLELSTLSLVPN